jgi:hypothetical protein
MSTPTNGRDMMDWYCTATSTTGSIIPKNSPEATTTSTALNRSGPMSKENAEA